MDIDPGELWWRPDPRDSSVWFLSVRVQPGASRTGAAGPAGPEGDQLKVRLASPPVDGRANTELVRWLAKELGVPRSAVTLERGETSRSKVLRIDIANRKG